MNDKYQDFLSKLQNADESERDWLVMEFSLQNLSETLRQAVWAAAIPHWFDHDFLNAVLANPLKDSDFQALTELSFIEIYPERGFNVHERSRNLLLDKLWTTNKTRYQKLSKRASAYCKKQDQSVAAWRVETLYQGLLANSLNAKDSFIKQSADWSNSFQFDKLENLTQVVLEAVGRGKLTEDIAGYAHDFQAELDIRFSRYESAKEHLKLALTQKTLNIDLKAQCLLDLGDAHYLLSEHDQARDCYQQALKFFQQSKNLSSVANCIKALGDLHFQLAEYDRARNYHKKALTIFQQFKDHLGEANCIQSLGDVHSSLAEYGQALDCYQKALKIYQQIKAHLGEANCIHSVGNIYISLAEYEQAQDCYQQALSIYKKITHRLGEANCFILLGMLQSAQPQTELAVATLHQAAKIYESLGDKRGEAYCFNELAKLYQRRKQFTPALKAFNQAIEIFPNHATWYQSRAKLCMQLEDYEKAEADIKQAETVGRNPAYTLLRKAELAFWRQQTPQAVEFCQQALAQRPADGIFRSFFALTLLTDGQTQLACTEMEQALTAIYQKHDFDYLLDALDKLTIIYSYLAGVDVLREQILKRCQKD